MSKMIEKIVPLNDHVYCKKVLYGQSVSDDPSDESANFFRVESTGDEDLPKGTLIKMNQRFTVQESWLDGEIYAVVDKRVVFCAIYKKDQDESLFG